MVNKAADIGVRWVQPVLEFKQESLGNIDSCAVSSKGLMLQNVVRFDVDNSVVLKNIRKRIALGVIVQGICHSRSHQLTTWNVFNEDYLEVRGSINTCVRNINTQFQTKDPHGMVNALFEVKAHTYFACKYPTFVAKRGFAIVRKLSITFDAMSFEAFQKSAAPKLLELSEGEMMQTRSMKVAMEELLRPRRESIQSVAISEGVEFGRDDDVEEMEVYEKFDVHDRETEVPLTPTPSSLKSPDMQNLSDAKRRKLDWDMLSGEKLKSALEQGGKSVVGTAGQGQSLGKAPLFPSMINLPKSRVDEVLKEKKLLQEELAPVGADVRNQVIEMANTAQEFQMWADGLKEAMEKQFHEVEYKISHLIADNNFLMNRLTPLIKLEEATLDDLVSFSVDSSSRFVLDFWFWSETTVTGFLVLVRDSCNWLVSGSKLISSSGSGLFRSEVCILALNNSKKASLVLYTSSSGPGLGLVSGSE
ncbi:hypothetical protein L7F22_046020 [Adiantum nelumboides]|nr:hypothetical protein [Adiantum nelumboides]